MAQDLRDMFEEDREKKTGLPTMKPGHSDRFLEKLDRRLPRNKKPLWPKLAIAASILVLVSAGIHFLGSDPRPPKGNPQMVEANPREEVRKEPTMLSLGDLSPDLKKVEDYYVTNINLVLSKIEVSSENKGMIDGFMEQLSQLDQEYERLNTELNTVGPNDQTITALIKNLELRLQLLQKLKTKLNELKTSKNEQLETNLL